MFIDLKGIGFGILLVLIVCLTITITSITSAFLLDKYLIKKQFFKISSKWAITIRIIIGLIIAYILYSLLEIAFSLVLIPRF